MSDKGKIWVGLLVFLALVSFPLWYNLVSGEESTPPELQLPTGYSSCVADTEFMRTDHMVLLMDWRDEVVRDKQRVFTAPDGQVYEKSLSGTCMGCHADKAEFCDKCHDYLGVQPYCWECHVEPKGGL